MKRSCVDVIPRNGQYIVRIIENGETKDHTFDFELHAQAFADGQHFRLLALEAESMVDSAEFQRNPDATPFSPQLHMGNLDTGGHLIHNKDDDTIAKPVNRR